MNILEIIKKAPKDHIYYNTLLGEARVEIQFSSSYPIKCIGVERAISCTKEGHFYNGYDGGECILFPSKDQRDWSKFEKSLDEVMFKPFDKVLCRDCCNDIWQPDFFGYIETTGFKYHCAGNMWKQCIPYKGNEDKIGKK